MKLNVIISILFAIVTFFSAIHEVEHISHDADSSCLVCTVGDNLTSADAVDIVKSVEIFHFEQIAQNNPVSDLHVKEHTNQNRAPPKIS